MAMYKELCNSDPFIRAVRPGFSASVIRSLENVQQWIDIGSEAFSYTIDYSVIKNLLNDKDVNIILGWQDDKAVAAALVLITGDVIGIHQVGVKKAFQGQGIARAFMHHIIEFCHGLNGKYLTLQASQSGQPLYQSLGFSTQFSIKNYQQIQP